MPTAKSYENFTICRDPYEEDGKMYVDVIGSCPRCGGSGLYSYNPIDGSRCYGCNGSGKIQKSVRWYTDAQRAAMDRAAAKRAETAIAKINYRFGPEYNGFGSTLGYITVVLGNTYDIKDQLKAAGARYKSFGWYFSKDTEVKVPEGYETLQLSWEDCSINGVIKDDNLIKELVSVKVRKVPKTEPNGEIGEKLTFKAKLVRNVTIQSVYGISHFHVFEGDDGAQYTWTTSVKSLEVDKIYTVIGTVKDHEEYNGISQTKMTRCKILQEEE